MTTLRPGTNVTVSAAPATRGTYVPTGTLFMPHFYDYGVENTPIECASMSEFVDKLGPRNSRSLAYDAAETYFLRGGKRLVASRVVGPTTVAATAILFDQSGSGGTDDALLLTAKGKHKYDNGLNYEVTVDGGNFEIIITHDTLDILEESGALADRAAAVTWGASSEYVSVSLGDSNEDPRAQTGSFSGGDDDYDNATITEWTTAIGALSVDLGPGQIIAPGVTTGSIHTALLQHASDRNRWALLDSADEETDTNMLAAVTTQRSNSEELCRYGQTFSNWVEIPGLASMPGTTREIPYSAVQAGIYAANDGSGLSPNVPGAGVVNGQARVANSVLYAGDVAWTPEEVDALNTGGVNVVKEIGGEVVTWGNRSLVSPDGSEAAWLNAANGRMAMRIRYEAEAIALRYVHALLDGQRRAVSRFGAELRAMLMPFVADGSLFVDPNDPRPETAFVVDVDSVNTAETMADGELNANIGLRMSPASELVSVAVTQRAITEAVA